MQTNRRGVRFGATLAGAGLVLALLILITKGPLSEPTKVNNVAAPHQLTTEASSSTTTSTTPSTTSSTPSSTPAPSTPVPTTPSAPPTTRSTTPETGPPSTTMVTTAITTPPVDLAMNITSPSPVANSSGTQWSITTTVTANGGGDPGINVDYSSPACSSETGVTSASGSETTVMTCTAESSFTITVAAAGFEKTVSVTYPG